MSLTLLTHESRLESPDLRKKEEQINAAISEWQNSAASIESELAAFRSPSRHLLTSKQLARAPELKLAAIDSMRAEYKLRYRIGEEYFPLLKEARIAAGQKALEASDAAQEKVKSQLVKMGYIDGQMPGGNFLSITPDMIRSHPHVYAASLELQSAQDVLHQRDAERANDEAMKSLGAKIDDAVNRLVATQGT